MWRQDNPSSLSVPDDDRRIDAPGFRRPILAALVTVLLVLTGCGRDRDTVTTAATTPDVAPQEVPAGDLAEDAPPLVVRPLVVWVPEFMTADGDTAAAEVLATALQQFEQLYPASEVEFVVKQEEGVNGILNYLRSAQRVAPAILPDLVVLNSQDLWRAVDLGLVQPLDTANLPVTQPIYPAALASARYQETIYGLPYAVDPLHAVGAAEQTLPATWDDVLAGGVPYIFAGGLGDAGLNPSLLLQYAAAGGTMTETTAEPDADALRALLEFYVTGQSAALIGEDTAVLADTEEVWSALDLASSPAVGLVSAHVLLRERDALNRLVYAPLPSVDGAARALAPAYTFAFLTTDPERLEMGYNLLNVLFDPTVHGNWAQFAQLLPSTETALDTWGEEQPYFVFLRRLLRNDATAIPNGRIFFEFARRLQAAQNSVLAGSMTVDEAIASIGTSP
ncbi:MAG: hypothetical protein KDE20_05025 [Caldilineaceae bacterium]|nr:hypothetical protein [Caldilineaceae bacterium]